MALEDPADVTAQRRMDYYKYVAEGPRPTVVVIQDEDGPNACGAFWGEVNTTIHKGFGVEGAVTNGLVRDLDALPTGFPVIAGAVGPSHAFVHVTDFDTPVQLFGMIVSPNDLIHADRHGALVIPESVHDTLEEAIAKLIECEKLILEPASKDGFDYLPLKLHGQPLRKHAPNIVIYNLFNTASSLSQASFSLSGSCT